MLLSSFTEKLIKLPNQVPSFIFDLTVEKKNSPAKIYPLQRITVKNQSSIKVLIKNNYNLVRSFDACFEDEISDHLALKKIIKRIKLIKLLYFAAKPKVFQKSCLLSKLSPCLYNKLSGICSPSILCQEAQQRSLSIQLLRKFKNLSTLNLNTNEMPESLCEIYSNKQLLELEYSLKCLRNLQSLSIIENFQFRYAEFIQLMTQQVKTKHHLKSLDLYVFQTTATNKRALTDFFRSLEKIQTLEELILCMDGKEMKNKNVKQLCTSLVALPSLKKVKLTIIQPMITKEYLRLNAIKCLDLEFHFKISSLRIFKINLLKKLTAPISVKLDDIEDKRFNDEKFVGYLFKNISKIQTLKNFTYSEDFNESLSFCSRHHLVKNFNTLVSKGFQRLSTLNLTFNNSLLVEFSLGALQEALPRMESLEGITINIFDYKNLQPSETSILSFLSALPQCLTLKELFFSVEGEVSKCFSQKMIDCISKCKQIRKLGNFSLKIDFELLLYFLSKIAKLEALESLLVWFSPLKSSLEHEIKEKAEKFYAKANDCFSKLKKLDNIEIKFPVSSIVNRELQEFKRNLLTRRRNLNVQIDSLPIQIENFF
jgi:hypothetical protein